MQRHPDAELIDGLGGPAALSRRLGYTGPGSTQRVHNWRRRGIPADVLVDHDWLRKLAVKGRAQLTSAHPPHNNTPAHPASGNNTPANPDQDGHVLRGGSH